ncbi:MAG: succinate dehydrogenase, cytochrome b556 subunit [Deltaproteobacteria bacterium]|nr:MAG: succinate dehydrogenase, cytochrome b556 subunit [Deltaproteobacteria bacterium]
MVIRHYRWHTGTWAWILHRLSGMALISYLVLHTWVIHHIQRGPEEFDALMEFVTSPLFKFGELGLFGVILYHTLNGIRIVLVDLGWTVELKAQKITFWALVAIGIIALGLGAYGFFH